MPGFTIKIDASKCLKALNDLAKKQIPFATATALNDLAFQVQRGEQALIQSTFKHPKPFTVKSVQVDRATKTNQTALVKVRPEAAKYLTPYAEGGVHALPGRALLNPKDIKLDQYGQLPRRTMAMLRARADIYIGVIFTRTGPVNGVWQRVQLTRSGGIRRKAEQGTAYHHTLGRVKLLIRFGDALPVNKHLDFQGHAQALVRAGMTEAFAKAMDKAMSTQR